jgi:hypothetical protein
MGIFDARKRKMAQSAIGKFLLMVLVVPFYVAKRAPFAGDLNR